MAYQLPAEEFNVMEWARNMTLHAGQTNEAIVQAFIRGYEHWWNIQNDVPGHTSEVMQELLRACPAAVDVLADAAAFRDFANSQFPGVLPARYHAPPYAISADQNGLIVGAIAEAWTLPVEEQPPQEQSGP